MNASYAPPPMIDSLVSDPRLRLTAVLLLTLLAAPALAFLLRSIGLAFGLLRIHFRPRPQSVFDEVVTSQRVGLFDCDPNLHITNSRYLALVDWGRFELLFRLGYGRLMRRLGYRMLMGTSIVRYRRSIDLFRRYDLHNRLLGWDEKWIFVEHRFVVGGRTAVMVLAKFVVTSGGEVVEPGRVLANLERALGGSPPDAEAEPLPSPELPDRVRLLLQDSDGLMSPD